MPIDDAATRTLRAAGLGMAPRNERLAELAGLRRTIDTGSYRLGFHPSGRPSGRPASSGRLQPGNAVTVEQIADVGAAQAAATPHRYCARPTCSRQAVATMSYDQRACTVYLGGLSPERDPAFYDLCRFHVDRLTPPNGWTVRRVRPTAVSDDGTDETAATLDGWSPTSPTSMTGPASASERIGLSSVLG